MSLVMAYFLFWMIFIYKQECAVIRLDHHNRNALEYVIQKYMNPLRKLSADLPNQAIEMEIEIQGSVPREVTNDPRRFIRTKNRRRPKPIPRAQEETGEVAGTANGTATTANTTQAAPAPKAEAVGAVSELDAPAPPAEQDAEPSDPQKIPVYKEDLEKALDDFEKKLISKPECLTAVTTSANSTDPGQAAPTPGAGAAGASAVSELGAPAPPVGQDAEPSDPQKIPVYKEDLEKALDDFEKKLISKPESLTAATTCGQNLNPGAATPQPSSQPARSVDDIVKMLRKAVSVEHRMPKAGDEKLEWLRIKIPKSI